MLAVGWALAHHHHIIGLQAEGAVTLCQVLVNGYAECFSHLAVVLGGVCIAHATEHIHLGQRGGICESACLQDEVFHRGVLGKLIYSGVEHLSVDGQSLLALHIHHAGDEEHIALAQRDVGAGTCDDAFYIHRHHLQCEVFLLPVHHGARLESILGKSVNSLEQVLYALYVAAQLELSGVLHCSAHLHQVAVARDDTIYIE